MHIIHLSEDATMTKAELIELIADLPDDCQVLVDTGEEFVHITGLNHPDADFGMNQAALTHEGSVSKGE